MEQPIKPKKVMTPEQLEILKARLMKARDAKIARTKGPVKEEPKQIPITNVVNEIVKETPFEKPLPKKRIPKPKPVKQPDVIPFEEPLPPSNYQSQNHMVWVGRCQIETLLIYRKRKTKTAFVR